MQFIRQTVSQRVEFEGLGLHTGLPVRAIVHPGEEGIAFRLGSERWPAIPENVTDTSRCTRLGQIGTIEHLMSALAGLEITDAEIELTAPELPALDGSSAPYVHALRQVGLQAIGPAELPDLFARVFLADALVKIAIGRGDGHWRYTYTTPNRWPEEQAFQCDHILECYPEGIAPARTFASCEEVPQILAAGMAKGLGIGQVLILGPEGYENPARFSEEPARHKLLDLVGDLYLAGIPIRFLNVSAERSGHRTNVRAAALLRARIRTP